MKPNSLRKFARFSELDLTCVLPEGWLRQYLELQLHGLTGHLDECGHPTFKLDNWITLEAQPNDVEPWWPHEQSGYWIDGMLRCALLLGDQDYIHKASRFIYDVIEHADQDSYLGPQRIKHTTSPSQTYRWPHAVFFRSFVALYGDGQDFRLVKALQNHYLSQTSPHSRDRDLCNIEMILWTYEHTGDTRLLDLAMQSYLDYQQDNLDLNLDTLEKNMLSDQKFSMHGVSFNEMARQPAILYFYTGEEKLLQAAVNAYRKVERDQVLVDGVHSSAEDLMGNGPLESHETCNITDYPRSLGYLLQATGDAHYADIIEKATFNALPGAVAKDFMAHQYFSCPNQVVLAGNTDHNITSRGGSMMALRPYHHAPCCTGNLTRALPTYVSRMWLAGRAGNEFAAVLYGPCRVTFPLEAGQVVTVQEETEYPFSEQVLFRIEIVVPTPFTLLLRIPGWCEHAELWINGEKFNESLLPGTFARIERIFANGDQVLLSLPMQVKLAFQPGDGIAVERGPLLYAYKVAERVDPLPKTIQYGKRFEAYDLYPAGSWNYALALTDSGELPFLKSLRMMLQMYHLPARTLSCG